MKSEKKKEKNMQMFKYLSDQLEISMLNDEVTVYESR